MNSSLPLICFHVYAIIKTESNNIKTFAVNSRALIWSGAEKENLQNLIKSEAVSANFFLQGTFGNNFLTMWHMYIEKKLTNMRKQIFATII